MKIKITFEPDKPDTRPTIIKIYNGSRAPIEMRGDVANPSVEIETNGVLKITRDFLPEPVKSFGASGLTLAKHD